MFFDKTDLNLDYIETLGFLQGRTVSKVPTRSFCALSIRLSTKNTRFYTEKCVTEVERGDILFVPPVSYTRRSEGDEVLCIHFRTIGAEFTEIEKYRPKNPQFFIQLFSKVFDNTRGQNPHYAGASGLYEILSAIKSEQGESAKTEAYPRVKRAIELINQGYGDRDLSVSRLAKECGLSESRFRQLFEKETGVSPRRFITAVRIRHATALLREGGFKMSDIAERVGFCDEKYLAAVFSKNTGLPPKAHRTVRKTVFEGVIE